MIFVCVCVTNKEGEEINGDNARGAFGIRATVLISSSRY